METLSALAYGGIAVLIVLLAVFEIKDVRIGEKKCRAIPHMSFTLQTEHTSVFQKLLVWITRFMFMVTAQYKQKKTDMVEAFLP